MTSGAITEEEIGIVEALLFSSPEPLTQSKMDLCFDNGSPSLKEAVVILNENYIKYNNSFFIEYVADGYRMVTKPDFDLWIGRLLTRTGKTTLSQASLEVLSIVAYRGPVTKVEIESIRGVNCDSSVKTLLEKRLIRIKGRSEGPGRALLYTVTDSFLITFGLKDLSELPKLREFKELTEETHPTDQISQEDPIENASE